MAEKRQKGGDAKESIVLFCKILKYSGIFTKLSPDDARQAKFNKPAVVGVLSEALQALIKNASGAMARGEATIDVVKSLNLLRYPRVPLLCNAQGNLSSSRELLLAIAWCIHVFKIFDQVRHEAMCSVDVGKMMGKEKEKIRGDESMTENRQNFTMTDKVNKVSWFVGQLDLLKQEIMSIETANAKRESEIASRVKPEFEENVLLLLLLKNPSLCTEYEKLLEKKISLLQCCVQWIKLQHIFWLWMDSVLSNASPGDGSSLVFRDVTCRSRLQPVLNQKLQILEEELTRQRQLYPEGDAEALLATLPPEQKVSLDREMEDLRRRLISPYHRPSLRCTKGDTSLHSLQRCASLQRETQRVKQTNDAIAEEIERMRADARRSLEAASARLSGIVLIPPEVPQRRSR